ncbi:MAG: hypothetical protein H2205_03520 [Citrobacter pasteurii]|uniref:DUF6387 family protein n=1 Tax=Citrobacter pasteurii TaxID=1563222 RepID=UPI0018354F90|nr:DUF6387 family protein [Citrobacter pasteurii]MBA4711546.1 hypothetical protein [Citrobacter pasteurii]
MKASDTMKAVKQWFKLSNYDVLQEITVDDLRYEVSRRLSLHRHDFSQEEHSRHERYLEEEAKILAGYPLLASSTERIPPTTKKKNPLVDAKLHVRHMTVNDISRYEALLRDLNLLQRVGYSSDAPSSPISKEVGGRKLRDIDEFDNGHPLYLWLNIKFLTDDEVIEHIKRMLPQWRKDYAVGEPAIGSFRFGLSTVKKVINLRVIPMLDLLLWAKRNDAKISNEQFSRLLYPNDSEVIRGGSQIKDTDKPFAEKVLTREFDRLFNLWLSKNDYMMDTKVAEAMKMNEKEEEDEAEKKRK